MAYRAAILTVSDRAARGQREDRAGPAVQQRLEENGWEVVRLKVVPDDFDEIYTTLLTWADLELAHVVFTVGGTGFGPRDITPEVTRKVIQREAPGLAEAMRQASLAKTPYAMLSRSVAGIRGRVLILNLPGSPKAAVENLEVVLPVLPHAIQLLWNEPEAHHLHQRMQQTPHHDLSSSEEPTSTSPTEA